jgi:hypothetical protein
MSKASVETNPVKRIVISDAIDELTKTEASTISFLSVDPEAFDSVRTIDCIGDWTNWIDRRFFGATWEDCLRFALSEKQAWVERERL